MKKFRLIIVIIKGIKIVNYTDYSYICKKQLKNKELDFRLYELIPDYELLKEQAKVNLLSPTGIEIRINIR